MKRTRSLLRRAACLLLAICLIAPVFCFSASAAQESTRIEFRAELPSSTAKAVVQSAAYGISYTLDPQI